MIWQEVIFTVGSLIFIAALIPALRSEENKPPISTALITASVLSAFALAYVTLELYYASTTTAITAGIWYALAVQQYERGYTWGSH